MDWPTQSFSDSTLNSSDFLSVGSTPASPTSPQSPATLSPFSAEHLPSSPLPSASSANAPAPTFPATFPGTSLTVWPHSPRPHKFTSTSTSTSPRSPTNAGTAAALRTHAHGASGSGHVGHQLPGGGGNGSVASSVLGSGSSWSSSRIRVDSGFKLLLTLELPTQALCLRFNIAGDHLAVGLIDGTINVYVTDSGALLHTLADEETQRSRLPVTCIRFVPVEAAFASAAGERAFLLVATYASGMVKCWHYPSGSCLWQREEARQSLALSFSADASRFATAGHDDRLLVYDAATGQPAGTCRPGKRHDAMDGHRMRVFGLAYFPAASRAHLLASGSWDNTLQFWDDRCEHATRHAFGPHVCGDAVDIDPATEQVLTGSWRRDKTLQVLCDANGTLLWDFDSGDKLRDFPEDNVHRSMLYCAQFVGQELLACAGGSGNLVRLVDRGTLNTVASVSELPAAVYALDAQREAGAHSSASGRSSARSSSSSLRVRIAFSYVKKTDSTGILQWQPKIAVATANLVLILRRSEK